MKDEIPQKDNAQFSDLLEIFDVIGFQAERQADIVEEILEDPAKEAPTNRTPDPEKAITQYSFKEWMSTTKVLDSASFIIEDLKLNDGIDSKIFINQYLIFLERQKIRVRNFRQAHQKDGSRVSKETHEVDLEDFEEDTTPKQNTELNAKPEGEAKHSKGIHAHKKQEIRELRKNLTEGKLSENEYYAQLEVIKNKKKKEQEN